MFIKHGSTENLKQFNKLLRKHVGKEDVTVTVTGTVKVHGMGVGVVIDRAGGISFQVHNSPVDHSDTSYSPEEFAGWRSYSLEIKHLFDGLTDILERDDEVLSFSAEFFGGVVQTSGSVAYAPNHGIYIYGVEIVRHNPDFDSTSNVTHSNAKYITKPVDMLRYRDRFSNTGVILADNFPKVTHTVNAQEVTYADLKALFASDVSKIEESCPVGMVVNPDGNLIAEGYVYVAELPETTTEYAGRRAARTAKFKVKGERHRRKAGHTHTGVENVRFNEWALESDALSNDRLQQMFDDLHRPNGFVSGLTATFIHNVMADIEKECYVFLEDDVYSNITPLLIQQGLRRPIATWYKTTLNEYYADEIAALAEEHKVANLESS